MWKKTGFPRKNFNLFIAFKKFNYIKKCCEKSQLLKIFKISQKINLI